MTRTSKILLEIAARKGREHDATMRALAAAHAGQDDAARTIAERLREMAHSPQESEHA